MGPDRPAFQSLIFFGGDFIYSNNLRGELSIILNKRANDLIQTTIYLCMTLLISCLAYIIYPLYTLVFEGKHIMPIPIILPFLDPDSNLGYYPNILNQCMIAISGICGNIGIEITLS